MQGSGGDEASPSSNTLSVVDFADHQVLQRTLGGDSHTVLLKGAFTGPSIVAIDAQVVDFDSGSTAIVPWTRLGDASDGTYSGTLTIPQGGWYKLMVRGLNGDGAEVARTQGEHRFGVGINILCIGQSNMVGFGGHSYTPTIELAGMYSNDRAWRRLTDPYDRGGSSSDVDYDAGSGASLVPSLVNSLAEYFPGIPLGIVPAAKGSAPLDCAVGAPFCWGYRNPDDHADPSNLYGNSVAKARAAGGVELIVMHQGETDATNATPGPQYQAALEILADRYREDLGAVPLFMCQLGRSTTPVDTKNRTDATMQSIRVAQHDSDEPPRVYLAATAIDLDVDSTDHYTKATHDTLGQRIAAAIAHHYDLPGAPAAYRGPEIASVSYADTSKSSIDVHLTHRGGADFTPASGINGFVVLDGGAPVNISSVTRKDAATINITLDAPIIGSGAVRYLYGKLPFKTLSGTVHDDSTLELPLEPTTNDLALP
jgi:hypothetical protein